jgi:hypothetical protein
MKNSCRRFRQSFIPDILAYEIENLEAALEKFRKIVAGMRGEEVAAREQRIATNTDIRLQLRRLVGIAIWISPTDLAGAGVLDQLIEIIYQLSIKRRQSWRAL